MNLCPSCHRRIPRHHRTCSTCARYPRHRETMTADTGSIGFESFAGATTEIPWLEPSRPDGGDE